MTANDSMSAYRQSMRRSISPQSITSFADGFASRIDRLLVDNRQLAKWQTDGGSQLHRQLDRMLKPANRQAVKDRQSRLLSSCGRLSDGRVMASLQTSGERAGSCKVQFSNKLARLYGKKWIDVDNVNESGTNSVYLKKSDSRGNIDTKSSVILNRLSEKLGMISTTFKVRLV